MNEVWGEIEDFPNYAISNYGEVINIKYGRYIKPRSNSRGYLHVMLFNGTSNKDFYIHQLVAMLFLGDFRQGSHIYHIDGNRSNNEVTNLRMRGGRSDKDYEPIRTRGRRVRIVETGQVFMNAYSCAEYIGGQPTNVYACLSGRHKRHLGYTYEYVEEDTHGR